MAYTKNQIVRKAYQDIGIAYNVTDVDTDTSQNGVYARDAWDFIVPNVFTKNFWNFALKREQLAVAAGVVPPQPWRYMYQIPSEAIAIVTIWPRNYYKIWGQYISCNMNPLYLDYQIIPAVGSWNSTFANYITALMAEKLAPVAAQNNGMIAKATEERKDAEAAAQVYVSQNQTAIPLLTAPTISCRYNYGAYGSGSGGGY